MGGKTDWVGKKLTSQIFPRGKKLTGQFFPRGKNGPGGFLKVKPKVNQKNQEKLAQAWFHFLFAFRWIPNTKT